ncbi:putative transcription factor bHLH family [Rosa chinensis]|uniref:Putative transcription factor bHLH family n=1 Tax=Rosa chinensis TaxID=74649 RepID=A0A2P6Q8P6_ROSCH|nr:putative transcription factor bHLH family [Rosa chinensis]
MLIWCLIPNSNKTDKASMLDEAVEYLKQLQLQVQREERKKQKKGEKGRNRRRGRREGQKRQGNPKDEKNCSTSQIQGIQRKRKLHISLFMIRSGYLA